MTDMDRIIRNMIRRHTPSPEKLKQLHASPLPEDERMDPPFIREWVAGIFDKAFSEMNRIIEY